MQLCASNFVVRWLGSRFILTQPLSLRCLCNVSVHSLLISVCVSFRFLVPPKQMGRQIGYSKLSKSVNEYVNQCTRCLAMYWCPIRGVQYSWIHSNLNKDKAVTDDENIL